MCANPKCPWGIGQHPRSLADHRDGLTVLRALQEAGPIDPALAKRRYAAWRAELQRSLTDRQDLPHVIRWKALSRLRDCLTPLIQAAYVKDEKEIARLRQYVVDYSYIAEYAGKPE